MREPVADYGVSAGGILLAIFVMIAIVWLFGLAT